MRPLTRAARIAVPRNPYSGYNTKTTGRVSQVKAVKIAGTQPVEFDLTVDETEKTAASFALPNIPRPMLDGFYSGLGALAATGAASAAAWGIGAGIDAFNNMRDGSKYDNSLRQAIRLSPSLQLHGYEELKEYMPMIIKASPTVASEPRLLANYLESLIDAEGHLNMATFAELSNVEGRVIDNYNNRHKLREAAISTLVKGIAEGAGKGVTATMGAYMNQRRNANTTKQLPAGGAP
jgi:hypothetical protein